MTNTTRLKTQNNQSLKAYTKKKKEGSLKGDRKKVYKIIKNNSPIGLKQIAQHMDKYPHQISGRITELKNQNLIQEKYIENGEARYEVKK